MKIIIFNILFLLSTHSWAVFKNGFEPPCNAIDPPVVTVTEYHDYPSLNDNQPFGESTSTSFELNLQTNRYAVVSGFSLPSGKRRMVFENAPTNYHLADRFSISVSECPGDFTATATCLMQAHNSSTLFFTTNSHDPVSWCKLEAGKEYFINYILTPEPFTDLPTCANPSHSRCAIFYSEAGL